MKIRLASLLVSIAVLYSLPAWAEERALLPGLGEQLLQVEPFELEKAKRYLEDLYQRGVQAVQDHIEVEGTFQPDANGNRWGHLSLRLYPKGRVQSKESLKAETWFGFSNKPQEDHLHFDFKFSKERSLALSPQGPI